MQQLIGPQTRQAAEYAEPGDRDAVLLAVVTHAEEACEQVWPGGTVDPTEIEWGWNPRFRRAAGKFKPASAVKGRPATIELAPAYYDAHGLLDLLEVARHELIHAWQYYHTDGGGIGHGPKFRQWVDDLETHRHCKHF